MSKNNGLTTPMTCESLSRMWTVSRSELLATGRINLTMYIIPN
jgi:hypothetical protein